MSMDLRPCEVLDVLRQRRHGAGRPYFYPEGTADIVASCQGGAHSLEDDGRVDSNLLADAGGCEEACQRRHPTRTNKPHAETNVSQCLTTALVESMMVPSMSNRRPSKVTVSGGAEKAGAADSVLPILCAVVVGNSSLVDALRPGERTYRSVFVPVCCTLRHSTLVVWAAMGESFRVGMETRALRALGGIS